MFVLAFSLKHPRLRVAEDNKKLDCLLSYPKCFALGFKSLASHYHVVINTVMCRRYRTLHSYKSPQTLIPIARYTLPLTQLKARKGYKNGGLHTLTSNAR